VSEDRQLGAASYARRIERRWTAALGRPVVLSPRDWETVLDWHTRGIPLEVVDEAIEAAAERATERGKDPPRGLSDLGPAVDGAWATIVGGRVGGGPGRGEPPPAPETAWRARAAAEPDGSPLRSLLQSLLDRLAHGESRATLDAQLDRALVRHAAPALLRDALREIDRDVAPHRSRIAPARLEEIRDRAAVRRLRQKLGLPALGRDRS